MGLFNLNIIEINSEYSLLCCGAKLLIDYDDFLFENRRYWNSLDSDLTIQLINADYVAGLTHLELIGKQIWSLYEKKLLISKNIELEILLRIACSNQISYSIKHVGVNKKMKNVGIIVFETKKSINSFYNNLNNYCIIDNKILDINENKIDFLSRFHQIPSNIICSLTNEKLLSHFLAEKAVIINK